ncbi:MAG: hypothetical protein EBW14_04435 [Oxalobacteraceae bacterium]|nr:hypothetical protein [Oxalobacteraceae bacterium]
MLEGYKALALIEIDDPLTVFEQRALNIQRILQSFDVALDPGKCLCTVGIACRVVLQGGTLRLVALLACTCLRIAAHLLKALGHRISKQRHVPEIDVVAVGLFDDLVALIECLTQCLAVALHHKAWQGATGDESTGKLNVSPNRLKAADDRLDTLKDGPQAIHEYRNRIGGSLCPFDKRPIVAQPADASDRVVGPEQNLLEFLGQDRKRRNGACHQGLGDKAALRPHPRHGLGGLVGLLDLLCGEPDVEVLVFCEVLQKGQHRGTRLAKKVHGECRFACTVLELGKFQSHIVEHLGRIAQIAARILGRDPKELQGLAGIRPLVIHAGKGLGELGEIGANRLHGGARDRRNGGQAR